MAFDTGGKRVMATGESVSCRTAGKAFEALLANARRPISNAMGGCFTRGMAAVSLALNRRMQDRSSARF